MKYIFSTRKHSSRMRTVRSPTVSTGGWVCLWRRYVSGGGVIPAGRVISAGGISLDGVTSGGYASLVGFEIQFVFSGQYGEVVSYICCISGGDNSGPDRQHIVTGG